MTRWKDMNVETYLYINSTEIGFEYETLFRVLGVGMGMEGALKNGKLMLMLNTIPVINKM